MGNRLDIERLGLLLHCLVEGVSCEGTARLAKVDAKTVYSWLDRAAEASSALHDEYVQDLTLRSLQADELWGYVYVKEKRVDDAKAAPDFAGDVWTWLALDRDTKLIVSCHVGRRGFEDAKQFVDDLAGRLYDRVQLTTDGHSAYLRAVELAFGGEIDFAQLVKTHTTDADGKEVVDVLKRIVSGNPAEWLISTSLVERVNRTMRMSNRRLIRRTDGFSKRVWRHDAMMRLLVMYYNFCRVHRTLGTTPAVAAGLTDHLWDRRDLAQAAIDYGGTSYECSTRGPYGRARAQGDSSALEGKQWGRGLAVLGDTVCSNCGSNRMQKDGKGTRERQRYRCCECNYRSFGEMYW